MFTLRSGRQLRRLRPYTGLGVLRAALLAAFAAAVAVAAASCGGGGPESAPAQMPTATEEAEALPTPEPTPPAFVGDLEAIWAEDFERYPDGEFPREGHWQRWKSGGVHQITSRHSVGGAKSYQLGKFAQTAKTVPQGMSQVTYTAKFMVPSVDESSPTLAVMIGLGWKMRDGNVPHASACGVWAGGQLTCGGQFLGLAEAGKWYEIHAVADLGAGSARYWLDGTEYGEFPLETSFGIPIDNVSHLLVLTGPREIEAYVDDVAVFRGDVGPLSASQP